MNEGGKETSTDRIVKPVTEHEFLLKIAANQSIKEAARKEKKKKTEYTYIYIYARTRLYNRILLYNSNTQRTAGSSSSSLFGLVLYTGGQKKKSHLIYIYVLHRSSASKV